MFEEKIFSALERIHTASRGALQQAVTGHGVSALQAQILHALHRQEGVGASWLATQLHVSKPTISDVLASLLEKNLVRKTPHKADARSRLFTLTARGHRTAAHIADYARPFLGTVGTLNNAQKQALWEALLHLLRTMESQGLIPHQRMCLTCGHFAKDLNGAKYYCTLMNVPLSAEALRIDCKEHTPGTGVA